MQVKREILYGLLAALGIALTAGIALPFVKVLNENFSLGQIMMIRGFGTAFVVGSIMIWFETFDEKINRSVWALAFVLPLATLGLFQGILHWGAGPTITIIAATPIINVVVSAIRGKRISAMTIAGLILLLGGVALAQGYGEFNFSGFWWSVFATVMNALLYKLISVAKGTPLQKCYCGNIGMGCGGLILFIVLGEHWAYEESLRVAGMAIGFVVVGGVLYWLSNMYTFKYLPTAEASVLAQAEIPFVIIGARILLKEQTTPVQWTGVIIALAGAACLSWLLAKKDLAPSESPSVAALK